MELFVVPLAYHHLLHDWAFLHFPHVKSKIVWKGGSFQTSVFQETRQSIQELAKISLWVCMPNFLSQELMQWHREYTI